MYREHRLLLEIEELIIYHVVIVLCICQCFSRMKNSVHLFELVARHNFVLPFQTSDPDTEENDENVMYDSDLDDLEDLLSELVRNKVELSPKPSRCNYM